MPANRFDQLIEQWEPKLRKAFLDAVDAMRDRADIQQITAMLERRDIEGALRAVGLDPVSFRVFDKAVTEAFEAGGSATATAVPIVRKADGFRASFQFNIRNPAAENWLRRHSGDLIQGVFDDQKQMIRDVLQNGLAAGANPRTTALSLVGRIGPNGKRQGGLIGLTGSQAGWVQQYAVELQTDPIKAIARKLRDKRFDATIARYVRDESPLPAELREKILTSYRNRALRFRAESIARTETMVALHESQQQAMTQALANGAVEVDQITYVWRATKDKRTRDSHRAMDGQSRPYGEMFVTGAGARLRYPGDEIGPAAETINCRCWREPKVDFLRGVR